MWITRNRKKKKKEKKDIGDCTYRSGLSLGGFDPCCSSLASSCRANAGLETTFPRAWIRDVGSFGPACRGDDKSTRPNQGSNLGRGSVESCAFAQRIPLRRPHTVLSSLLLAYQCFGWSYRGFRLAGLRTGMVERQIISRLIQTSNQRPFFRTSLHTHA